MTQNNNLYGNQLKKYIEAIETFEDLVSKGLIKKRGYNLLCKSKIHEYGMDKR